jgi:hypothetical protein
MTHIPTFKYMPLNRPTEIRVVTLQRGSIGEPICCKLTNVDFTQRYEAVSYEWGPRCDKELIYVNSAPHMIRKNLYNALIHFRRSKYDRHLWIDALCINQKDIPEKNRQLRMMGTIYKQAWDTLVWLGLAHHDSDLAISHLHRIGLNDHRTNLALLCDEDEPYEREMRAIMALCNRTYWHRIWIIQEIRLSSQVTVCCGDKTIPGETFSLAGKHIQEATNPRIAVLLQTIRDSLASRIIDYSHLKDLPLKKWLIKTYDSLSTDPRDKVYALVNLAMDCRGSSNLIVDCSKSVCVSQVYKDVLKVCCADKFTRKPVHDVFDLSQVLQRALNNSRECVRLTAEDTEEIWICGIFSARITSFQKDRRAVRNQELGPKNIFAGDNTTVYTKASNCILAPDACKSMEIIRKRRFSDPKAPVQIVNDIKILATPPPNHLDDTVLELKPRAKNPGQCGKPFWCSGQECSGFAPTDAELGDQICRFPGSRIGLVFRQLVGREDSWRLVGRAIMDDRFQISEKETESFWRGDPRDPSSVSFGCDNAWYLRLSMVTLQRLTTD